MTLPVSPAGRRYGLLPSKPDHRDFGLTRGPLLKAKAAASSVDLEPNAGPVKDQGDLGACTMFAGSGNREYLARKFEGKSPVLSPLFGYYLERQLDGTLSEGDSGSTGRTACQVMKRFGLCLESLDGYSAAAFQIPPTTAQLSEATEWKAGAYHAILAVQDMKSCLASGYPVLIGFTVYESFESDQVASTGLMPVPDKNREKILGGHEVLVLGYDDSKSCPGSSAGAFKVRNSWGVNWGAGGNFWMPYQAAADREVLMDSWIQHLGNPW